VSADAAPEIHSFGPFVKEWASMRRCITVFSCVVALLMGSSSVAHGDTNTARRHFEAGKKLRDEGDCARAISEFEKSIEAEKSVGGYYNLGFCHEQLGRRQEAYEAYKSAQQLASAKKDDRLREISGAIASLLERPHIRLVLPQPLPDGIQITVDDKLVPERFYQAETVIFTNDAATHVVVVTAPGYEKRREVVETKQVKPIELRRPTPTRLAPSPPPVRVEKPSWTWQHWTGLGSMVVGAGLFTVGTVMFVQYRSKEAKLRREFEVANRCDADGIPGCTGTEDQQRKDLKARYEANERSADRRAPTMLGTVIGGGLMMAGGVFLFLTAPKSTVASPATGRTRVAPMFGASGQGLLIEGTF